MNEQRLLDVMDYLSTTYLVGCDSINELYNIVWFTRSNVDDLKIPFKTLRITFKGYVSKLNNALARGLSKHLHSYTKGDFGELFITLHKQTFDKLNALVDEIYKTPMDKETGEKVRSYILTCRTTLLQHFDKLETAITNLEYPAKEFTEADYQQLIGRIEALEKLVDMLAMVVGKIGDIKTASDCAHLLKDKSPLPIPHPCGENNDC